MKGTTMTLMGLYLFTEKNFKDMKKHIESYMGTSDFHAVLKDKIAFDGQLMQLYMISTKIPDVMFFADVISTPDGEFKKNKYTGTFGREATLPFAIKNLFRRNFMLETK